MAKKKFKEKHPLKVSAVYVENPKVAAWLSAKFEDKRFKKQGVINAIFEAQMIAEEKK